MVMPGSFVSPTAFVLVSLPAGMASAPGDGLSRFFVTRGWNTHRKITNLLEQFKRISGRTDQHREDRFAPYNADGAPADGHGVADITRG
jgi:hypothetical protein